MSASGSREIEQELFLKKLSEVAKRRTTLLASSSSTDNKNLAPPSVLHIFAQNTEHTWLVNDSAAKLLRVEQ